MPAEVWHRKVWRSQTRHATFEYMTGTSLECWLPRAHGEPASRAAQACFGHWHPLQLRTVPIQVFGPFSEEDQQTAGMKPACYYHSTLHQNIRIRHHVLRS